MKRKYKQRKPKEHKYDYQDSFYLASTLREVRNIIKRLYPISINRTKVIERIQDTIDMLEKTEKKYDQEINEDQQLIFDPILDASIVDLSKLL